MSSNDNINHNNNNFLSWQIQSWQRINLLCCPFSHNLWWACYQWSLIRPPQEDKWQPNVKLVFHQSHLSTIGGKYLLCPTRERATWLLLLTNDYLFSRASYYNNSYIKPMSSSMNHHQNCLVTFNSNKPLATSTNLKLVVSTADLIMRVLTRAVESEMKKCHKMS